MPRKYSDEQINEGLKFYMVGKLTLEAITAKTGISGQLLNWHRNRRNIPKRRRVCGSYKYTAEQLDLAIQLYRDGNLTVKKITERTGVPHQALRYQRKRRGIPDRPRLNGNGGFCKNGDRDRFVCPMCSIEKPRSAFYNCSGRSSGIDSRCKKCKEILRKWRRNNPGMRTVQDKRIKMGIKL